MQYILDKFPNITQLKFRPGEIKDQAGTAYNQGSSLMHAASLLYPFRPNKKLRHQLKEVVDSSLPKDFSSENT